MVEFPFYFRDILSCYIYIILFVPKFYFLMKYSIILLFILNFIVRPYGQDFQVSNSSLKHTINLNDYVDTWKFSIQSLEMVKPGGNSYANFILQEKVKATNKYPIKPIMLNPRSYNNFPEFLIENGFEGNLYNN